MTVSTLAICDRCGKQEHATADREPPETWIEVTTEGWKQRHYCSPRCAIEALESPKP